MKKFFVTLVAIGLISGIVNAQKIYVRLGAGGGIGLKQYGSLVIPDDYYTTKYAGDHTHATWADITTTDKAQNVEMKSMGLGGGFNVNLDLGYMLSKYIGIELGVNEYIGLSNKVHYSETHSTSNYSSTTDNKLSGMMLQVVPAIVITAGLETLNPYARLGMIIGVMPSVTEKNSSTSTYTSPALKATSSSESVMKMSGGVALGFTAAAGAEYQLGEKLGLFAELVYNGITYSPSKGKYKTYTLDGDDILSGATTRDKEWTYEKKFDSKEVTPYDSPSILPKMTLEFSNVELNIGVKVKF
ncbi:MAG: outer membrane beta-barrel protein [Bacteroidales bacterium]